MSNAKLIDLDIEFLLDMSGSMAYRDCAGEKTRWSCAKKTCLALVKSAACCVGDGITVTVFNTDIDTFENVSVDKVASKFKKYSPRGGSYMANAIKSRLDAYFARKECARRKGDSSNKLLTAPLKPLRLFVITDGRPADEIALKYVISEATRKMDRQDEILIYFVPVGRDLDATAFLKNLEPDLQLMGVTFDIAVNLTVKRAKELLKHAQQSLLVAFLPFKHHQTNELTRESALYVDDAAASVRSVRALSAAVSEIYSAKSDVVALVKNSFPQEIVFEFDWRTPQTAIASLVSWCARHKKVHRLVQILMDEGHSRRFGMTFGVLLSAGVIVPAGKARSIGADESSPARWSSDAAEVDRRGVAKAAQFGFDDMRCFLP